MRAGLMSIVLISLLVLGVLAGCQSDQNAQETSSLERQGEVGVDDSIFDYALDTDYSYQGVSIKGDADWSVSQPEDYNFYIKIDDANSHITIQTALHGQTESLASAWAEYTNAASSPEIIDSWESDGVVYSAGRYEDKYLMVSGCETASGKGFLLWMTFNTDIWSDGQAKKLFEGVKGTLSYDPKQTAMDYKDAFRAQKQTNAVGSQADSPSPSANSNDSDDAAAKCYREGTYKVGSDIPAGEYKLTAEGGVGYWEVTDSSSPDADIVGNDNFEGSAYVTVAEGQYLKLNRCYAELA